MAEKITVFPINRRTPNQPWKQQGLRGKEANNWRTPESTEDSLTAYRSARQVFIADKEPSQGRTRCTKPSESATCSTAVSPVIRNERALRNIVRPVKASTKCSIEKAGPVDHVRTLSRRQLVRHRHHARTQMHMLGKAVALRLGWDGMSGVGRGGERLAACVEVQKYGVCVRKILQCRKRNEKDGMFWIR
ncbi:hypothetical protein BC830DRAFT_480658 [Chytriomyces sp. MP71]|nr:hypothetical protein BC830DRAFT_480658 [Chytriomyces sp. MP71]